MRRQLLRLLPMQKGFPMGSLFHFRSCLPASGLDFSLIYG
jgi:hypothetical protein